MTHNQNNSNEDDPELELIDHVIRLFQKAPKSQSTKNIKLTLGLKNGEEYFVYSVYLSKASKKRNRWKPRKVPVQPGEETVDLANGPSETIPPPPPSEPSLSPMET